MLLDHVLAADSELPEKAVHATVATVAIFAQLPRLAYVQSPSGKLLILRVDISGSDSRNGSY